MEEEAFYMSHADVASLQDPLTVSSTMLGSRESWLLFMNSNLDWLKS